MCIFIHLATINFCECFCANYKKKNFSVSQIGSFLVSVRSFSYKFFIPNFLSDISTVNHWKTHTLCEWERERDFKPKRKSRRQKNNIQLLQEEKKLSYRGNEKMVLSKMYCSEQIVIPDKISNLLKTYAKGKWMGADSHPSEWVQFFPHLFTRMKI